MENKEVVTQFQSFKEKLVSLASNFVLDIDNLIPEEHIDPGLQSPIMSFTFFLSEEDKVDQFVRLAREQLLLFPRFNKHDVVDGYVFSVWKTHIQSRDYWNVNFWLSDKYEYTEDSQP